MPAESGEEKTSRCPVCGHVPLEQRVVDRTFEYGAEGETVKVEARSVPVEVCPQCGETFSGPRTARAEHDAICRTLGLLTPDQIRQVRERLGLTQEEFSRLTGLGVATVSRWERGRLVQNRA